MTILKYFLIAAVCCLPLSAKAQGQPDATAPEKAPSVAVEIMPVKSAMDKGMDIPLSNGMTHPPVHITPDKSEVVRLDGKATTILVGNPAHLSVLADTQETLVLVAREPGASAFTVLDADQNIIMQRHVIVASPQEKYVRIRRSCASGEDGCQATSMFYCPDMCHEVQVNPETEVQELPEAANPSGGGGSGSAEEIP